MSLSFIGRLRKTFFGPFPPQLWATEPKRHFRHIEHFRILKNQIAFFHEKKKVKTFLFTGVSGGCGVSSTVFNLAVICGREMPERRILLIDNNIFNPCLHISFDLPPAPGFLNHLHGNAQRTEIFRDSGLPNLKVVPLGNIEDGNGAPFQYVKFMSFLKDIRDEYDFIFIDSEPIHYSSHTQSIAYSVEGVILVVEAQKSRIQAVRDVCSLLERNDAQLLGSFLNRRRYVIPSFLYDYL